MTILAVPRPAASARRLRTDGGPGLPWQGWRGRCARGLALCPQQPGLAATDRDVPRRRHRADRSGDDLCATPGQRSASARIEGKSQRVRTRFVATAFAFRTLREGPPWRTRRRAPVGFIKAGDRLEKDPDRRVQEAISLVFNKVAGARQRAAGAALVPRARSRAAGKTARTARRHGGVRTMPLSTE